MNQRIHPAMAALARHGRGRDTVLAHMTPGEVALPPELLAKRPDLMATIAKVFAEEGIKPENRVVSDVGTNPDTGLPEYGWWKDIKDTVKDVFDNDIVQVAATVAAGALGGAPAAAAAGGLTSWLGGDTIGEAALSGLGTYLGSEFLGNQLGDYGTVGDVFGNLFGAGNASTPMNAILGAALGNFGGKLIGGMVDPPKQKMAALGSDIDLPKRPALPNAPQPADPNSNPSPQSTADEVPSGSGVSYLAPLKDRNTGQISLQPVSSNLSQNYGSPLAQPGWGNVILV
jgi:hypothetical protein